MQSSGQDLILNVLPFEHPRQKMTFGFYRTKKEDCFPLQQYEFPLAMDPDIADNLERLYTDFSDPENAEFRLEVDLGRSRKFAAHYYNSLIYKAMKGTADYRRRNFVYDNQLWFRDEEADTQGFHSYRKFIVKATVGRYTRGPELSVMFDGHSLVQPRPVLEYSGSTRDLNYILYRGQCLKYDNIPEDFDIDYSEAYPVINRGILERLDKTLPFRRTTNKVKRYYRQIEALKKEYLLTDRFREYIPLAEGTDWLPVKKKKQSRISSDANTLVFGGKNTHRIPFHGVRKYGPYRAPGDRHFRIFFIMHENDRRKAGARLYRYLNGDIDRVDGLKEFVNLPMELTDNHLIFENEDDPFPEIADKLHQMTFEEDIRYLAVYVSPITKEEKDPEKHRAYYRIKEELLKHGVASQVVERQSVSDPNFRYFMPNIAVGILAKLGGVPWQLDNLPEPELIVGVGAFKPRNLDNRYVGNAFCFSNKGEFYGFECYVKDETDMLAGSIRKAVRTYAQQHEQIQRLVIHFYKRMSYKERKPIVRMLHNLGLDIPVIVVSINKTESRDIAVFDRSNKELLPLSGTYVQVDYNTYLLCNNTRYFNDSDNLRSYPFPVKMRMSATDDEILNNRTERKRLIRQVYQFSRIYWKSVSQQNLPVTIKYPEMVAKMFPYFESRTMPEFGTRSLWFL